jgi:hypothetical protein
MPDLVDAYLLIAPARGTNMSGATSDFSKVFPDDGVIYGNALQLSDYVLFGLERNAVMGEDGSGNRYFPDPINWDNVISFAAIRRTDITDVVFMGLGTVTQANPIAQCYMGIRTKSGAVYKFDFFKTAAYWRLSGLALSFAGADSTWYTTLAGSATTTVDRFLLSIGLDTFFSQGTNADIIWGDDYLYAKPLITGFPAIDSRVDFNTVAAMLYQGLIGS